MHRPHTFQKIKMMGNISIHDIENAIHDVILDSNPNTLTTREVRIQLEKQRVIIDEITMRMLVKKLKPIEELDVINEQKGIGLKNASTSESSDSSDDESSVVQCFNEDDYSDDSSDISIFDIFSEDEKEGNDAVPSSSNSNLSPPEQKNSELEDEMLARRLHLEELGCRQRSTKYYSHIKRCLVRSRDQALSSAKEKKTPTTIASESFLSPALTNLLGAQKMRRSELVRRMWEIIKERNLLENFESMNFQDPTNRAFVICDTQFEDIFKCKRFKAFTMMKYLKFHVSDVSPFEN
ncbi:Upstream activation factor subunit spp27 [Trichinella britovi]|uniref:Upstream activation factor subunit spp27 n=1 Tax=Trichinella britovi TaxID=45882 RepID=A0A0V1C8I2_TRIBR|nr:Upstream activation factor subunit spp27 [Trichinella britovi]